MPLRFKIDCLRSHQLDGHGGAEVLAGDWDKYNCPVVATGCADGSVRLWDLRHPRYRVVVLRGERTRDRRVQTWESGIQRGRRVEGTSCVVCACMCGSLACCARTHSFCQTETWWLLRVPTALVPPPPILL